MKTIKLVLNPIAGRNFSSRVEPDIVEFFKLKNVEFDIAHTQYVGHGIELAYQAAKDKYDIVVAVGGDGTTNEVINGLMQAKQEGYEAKLGLLPTGTGCDFSYSAGIPENIKEACQVFYNGNSKKIDLVKFNTPGKKARYFDNQLGIGFDGIVTLEAKKIKFLRGLALYLPVVFKTVFVIKGATKTKIKYDNNEIELSTCQISISNGSREGGGFFMTPTAKIDDGLIDLLIVKDVSKLKMLNLIGHFFKGTHINLDCTELMQAKKVTITSNDNLIAHFDGEMLCTEGHKIECEIVPLCLEVVC